MYYGGKIPASLIHLQKIVDINNSICLVGLLVLFIGLGWLISQSVEEHLVRWRQAAELTCDRASLLVAQDPKVYTTSTSYMLSNKIAGSHYSSYLDNMIYPY